MNKKLLFPLAALTIFGSVVYGAVSVRAADNGAGKDEMISTLAAKLGIAETEVQSAFDEIHTERQAEMKARYESNLDELVAASKITAEQKSAILAKHEELRAKHEAERSELKSWAEENGIDLKVVGPLGMGHGMKIKHFNRAF
jgi:hypothetical protein